MIRWESWDHQFTIIIFGPMIPSKFGYRRCQQKKWGLCADRAWHSRVTQQQRMVIEVKNLVGSNGLPIWVIWHFTFHIIICNWFKLERITWLSCDFTSCVWILVFTKIEWKDNQNQPCKLWNEWIFINFAMIIECNANQLKRN